MEMHVIAVVSPKMGIGYQGQMPWHLPEDIQHFKKITYHTNDPAKRNAVLMGRKTWYSIQTRHRPLKGRLNVVLSRKFHISESSDVVCSRSLQEALEAVARDPSVERVFVAGGTSLYQQCMQMDACKRLYLTEILKDFPCDAFFPSIDRKLFRPISLPELDEGVQKYGETEYKYVCYQRKQQVLTSILKRFF